MGGIRAHCADLRGLTDHVVSDPTPNPRRRWVRSSPLPHPHLPILSIHHRDASRTLAPRSSFTRTPSPTCRI
ncbi:hypothetical protein E2C01_038399 [Portunus trituberculatus]|uniref:Uncharacterized protein n=1 Tax=Portunus trituberculatus TaxID=210409 RepID=A0A5B7FC46_PORTR|nr:hypothetical protein [Portunus trituberculatus]